MIYAYTRLRYQVSVYRTIGPLVSVLSLRYTGSQPATLLMTVLIVVLLYDNRRP